MIRIFIVRCKRAAEFEPGVFRTYKVLIKTPKSLRYIYVMSFHKSAQNMVVIPVLHELR